MAATSNQLAEQNVSCRTITTVLACLPVTAMRDRTASDIRLERGVQTAGECDRVRSSCPPPLDSISLQVVGIRWQVTFGIYSILLGFVLLCFWVHLAVVAICYGQRLVGLQRRHGSVCVQRSTDIELWVAILGSSMQFRSPSSQTGPTATWCFGLLKCRKPLFCFIVYRHTVFSRLYLSQYIFIGTTMAVRRNLFPWIRLHIGAMNSIKLATPICLISCICFFQTFPSNFLYLHYSQGSK